MGSMPIGKAGVEYDEVCMRIRGYAEKLIEEKMSYASLLNTIDRMTALATEARKLWGDR